jgi:hypothetical protein
MISLSSCICALLFAKLAVGAPAASSSAVSSVQSVTSSAPTISSVSSVPLSSSLSASRPRPTPTTSGAEPSATVDFASTDPNEPLWDADTNTAPQPIRGSLGAPLLGPSNLELDKQNADLLAPPTTDHGSVFVLLRDYT